MHQAFYRKWRPQIFDDVCGQEHITSVLRYEAEHGAFSHAYLFCGSRGTGKTTCAKILAKVVNCEHPVNGNPCGVCDSCRAIDAGSATDILEMDAASNNGVDNIRDIREEVAYAPSALKYRVYIIDEVHMLSVSAFNALLKTLEEPPEHVIFILATTELQKLPATIISRCQRFDFRRISTDALVKRLTYIAEEEKISLEPDAARMLAKLAQGGMRDAISLLELCAGATRSITAATVNETVGTSGREALLATVQAILEKDYDKLFEQVDEIVRSSKDLAVFWQDLISVYRDILIFRTASHAETYLDLTDFEARQIGEVAKQFRKETLLYHCKLLEDAFFAMQRANAVKRVVAELTLVRMCDESLDVSNEALLSRIAGLEDRIALGTVLKAPEKRTAGKKESSHQKEGPMKKAVEPTGPKRVLHPLRNWKEVVERLQNGNPMVGGFFKSAEAYLTDEGIYLIRFRDAFSAEMAMNGDGKLALQTALSAVLKQEVREDQLTMETVGKQQKNDLDEIVESTKESL